MTTPALHRASALALGLAACAHAPAAPERASPAEEVTPGTLIDARTEDGELQHFRIDAVERDPRDRDGDTRLYGVSILRGDTQTWQPYCKPDIEGRTAAIPVQGAWSSFATFETATDLITFACTGGAIGKCIRFGYKPWQSRGGASLAPYHAACVRMVRADYCGDGRPHTLDGTWIDIWDGLGIQTREEREGHPEVFEAAWAPTGAAYLNVPRWSDDVGEVTRDCPEHFAGRTSHDRALAPSEVAQQFPEVLLFNARFVHAGDRRGVRH